MLPRPPRPTPLPYPPLCRSSRGGRPPAFDREVYKHRNVVERCFNRLKQWRGIATRYDKTAQSYEAAVTLASLLIDRKSTRLNSSHANISYAVFCLKKITLLTIAMLLPPLATDRYCSSTFALASLISLDSSLVFMISSSLFSACSTTSFLLPFLTIC